jgi:triosephosphate isomerase
MARKLFIAGNWKMNLDMAGATALATALRESIGSIDQIELAVFPPYVYLPAVVDALEGSTVGVGAQNMYYEDSGAFTGEISSGMILDVGCKYVLLGHSERRHVLGEEDEGINRKVRKAIDAGLDVVLAVGELLEQREAEKTEQVVTEQVEKGLAGVDKSAMAKVTIAYEPVWAIGTGKTATPDQAQEVHALIRSLLENTYDGEVAQGTRIQYGGSVKPANAADLLGQPDVDGALVGGASLKTEDFTAIVKAGL